MVARRAGVPPTAFAKIREYALLFWANRGNHNETTAQKFLPTFTFEELEQAPRSRRRRTARFKTPYGDLPRARDRRRPGKRAGRAAARRSSTPTFEPMITAKTPPPGKDILQASANTFYQGVTLADLKAFQEHYPLNSRVVKDADGAIREEVYRAGTPDGKVPPGLYASYLKKAIEYLEKARGGRRSGAGAGHRAI